jgi:endonuclease YncB( thermonuclease family)
MSGLLKVFGTIDTTQFWPEGESDADTTKITVKSEKDGFQFQPHPETRFRVTHAFENATVIGRTRKPPIDKKGRLTIRLQGIDAPELHYKPTTPPKTITEIQKSEFRKLNKSYRQHLGETAAIELKNLLSQSGKTLLPCTISTAVDSPNDVFDTYGRFVGDIEVPIKGKVINLNHWLVREGWAFPAFYNSMSNLEIFSFLATVKEGQKRRGRLWGFLQKKIEPFNFDLLYRKKGAIPRPTEDKGPVIMPKLFRRQCTWATYKKAGIIESGFRDFLKENRDAIYLTDDFLKHGVFSATPRLLSEFLNVIGDFDLRPQGLVFIEKPSKLIGQDRQIIDRW